MTIILFIVILSVLVFVHELGHFIFAKWSKMRVDEFAIGFPPRIWSTKRGETEYSINALPIGGYVKIHGENPDDESLAGSDASRSFTNRPRYLQALVLVAGVMFNVLFAWVVISVGLMIGFPTSTDFIPGANYADQRVVIGSVLPDSPAATAEFAPGDVVVSAQDEGEKQSFTNAEQFKNFIQQTEGEFQVTVLRGTEEIIKEVTPEVTGDNKLIGVALSTLGTLKLLPHEALWYGAKLTWYMTEGIAVGLYNFVTGAFNGGEVLSQVAGPVGIARLVGDAQEMGFVYVLSFTALISINLAIINILPFPALDGGRLLFVFIESITRRRIPHKFANLVNAFGMILLLGLMAVVTVSDIVKLF